jgi:polyhydroxyalkanoate synthase
MLDGIQRYRHHPYFRDLEEPPVLWHEGTTRLIDFRGLREGPQRGAVMLVPSLVNRGYVLDLTEKCSLARWLAAKGVDVLLVDWSAPGQEEQQFALNDYVARLGRAAAHGAEACGRPIGLLGYCMGGLLTLPLAAGFLGPNPPVDRLVLLATPWDFHADRPSQAQALGAMAPWLEPLMQASGVLPTDMIQALFGALDPFLAMKKFTAFARMDPQSARAEAFVALEDWLNDGVPLAAPVARECLGQWYSENRPGTGRWRLSGFPVRPGAVSVPSLALVPAGDRIVPPGSASALARAIPDCRLETPKAGHIGMIVGGSADRLVWEPIRAFLAEPSAAA